jgi:A/G-specific adenine glycosylase
VRGALLSWFEENARDLPWRRTRDPWRILVSEVMLQQIQVKRAIPFYERFLKRFPTVEALAEAPLSDAIRVWGDLGRYRRVVNLHRTARIVVDDHGGLIPSDPEALLKLPGIGPYTAGAVACFAYERDVPFYDTNMHRVLHRVFFGPDVPAASARPGEVIDLASGLVPPGRGWAWNQAVMEFGALRCTARRPACEGCPLHDHCKARPKIHKALVGLPRAKKDSSGPKYEDTTRYLRGRVLARLREEANPGGLPLSELARLLRENATDVEPVRLMAVVESLERDGLARVTDASERPEHGPADAVAEERAPYSTGTEQERPGETRVSLP